MLRLIALASLAAVPACQKYDKAAHFAAGAAISYAVKKETGSAVAGCAAAIGAGLLKEAIDRQPDGGDIAATGLGCSVALAF